MSLTPAQKLSVTCAAAGLVAGGVAAAAPASAATTLTPLTTGSTCRYLNPAAAPAGAWTTTAYDDAAWRRGATPMGHQETVATDIGTPAKTAYVRCGFTVPATFATHSATVTARVDDGAVLYVNGTEVARTNMPAGAVGFGTSASTVDPYDGTRWQTWTIPAAQLRTGSNVLAVEVHQNFTSTWISSDATFDAKVTLTGAPASSATTPPATPTSTPTTSSAPTTAPSTPASTNTQTSTLPTYRVGTATTPVTDASGTIWAARTGFVGGTPTSTTFTGEVRGTTDDNVYRNAYYGMTGWSRTLPNGTYDVTLRMRETWWSAPAQRVFDVTAEGKTVLSAVDIAAAVGKDAAYDRTFAVTVTDGRLDLGFVKRVDNPIVSAIAVVPAPTTPTGTPPSSAPSTTSPTTSTPSTTPSTTSTPTTSAPTAPAGQKLVFADEFSGAAVDGSAWKAYNNTYGDGDPAMLHCLTPNNVSVGGGTLKITARKQTVTCANGKVRDYTSGFLGSRDVQRYYPLYGRYAMRARVPHGQGLFPALWLRHRNGSGVAEVDIFENFFTQVPGKAMSTLHFPSTLGYNVAKKAAFYENPVPGRGGWHTFSVDIAPVTPGDDSKVTFTFAVDGVTTLSYTNSNASAWTSVDKSAAWDIALQLYVGGQWTGNPDAKLGWLPANGGICALTYKAPANGDPASCPTTGLWLAPWNDATFEIDYVRVYSKG